MDARVMQHYLDQVPVEIREAIMELDTPHKWAVYIALTVDGDKYFNQLKKQFNANPKTLTEILKSLVASGLVDRKVRQLVDVGDTNRNYYTTTKMGEKLLENLYEVVLPPLAIGKVQPQEGMVNFSVGTSIENIHISKQNIPYQNLRYSLPTKPETVKMQIEGVPT